MKSIKDVELKNSTVLLRSSLNLPINNNRIQNEFRLIESLPTIKYILQQKCKLIICGHFARPDGVDKTFSMNKIRLRLQKLLNRKIKLISLDKLEKTNGMENGDIVLLENLRFDSGESDNSKSFASKLADLADIYIQDSFETAHRKHASIVGVPELIPTYSGLLFEKEINTYEKLLKDAKHPVTLILGGGKKKFELVDKIKIKYDHVLGGSSFMNKEFKSKKVILPVDASYKVDEENSKNLIPMDIGEETIKLYKDKLKSSKTIIWLGPVGNFYEKQFEKGCKELSSFISKLKATKIIGGGDSTEMVIKYDLTKKFTHVSTGGGASLELLKGHKLPAVSAIEKSQKKFNC